MTEFIVVIGVIGSIASLVSLFLPTAGRKGRLIHAVYVIIVTVVVALAVYNERKAAMETAELSTKLEHIKNVEKNAENLVKSFNSYTHKGFIQATLVFLEKHRDLFPETYDRAKEQCDRLGCFNHTLSSVDAVSVAFEMKGLIQGIASISR